MKKKEKIVKVLSDGTVAKVGMIVVLTTITEESLKNSITKIKATVNKNAKNKRGLIRNLGEYKTVVLTEDWFAYTSNLRKATPEERKQYYAELHARNK